MTRPVVGNFAEQVYAGLEVTGVTAQDEAHGWALLMMCEAIGVQFETIMSWAFDDDELVGGREYLIGPDHPGWSKLLDVDRAPDLVLPWLAQFAGVKLGRSMTAAEQRAAINAREGWSRGTPASMIAAAQKLLTGAKTVVYRERYDIDNPTVDSAYHLTVFTYTSETPDAAAVEAALVATKPAGIVLHYEARTGDSWDTVDDNIWTVVDNETWTQIAGVA